MSTDNPNYPKLEEYRNNLQKLYKQNMDGLKYEEIYNLYFDAAIVLQILGGYFVSEKTNGRQLYRVRASSQINELEDLSLIQTYSYPPTNICKNNGRGNIKHKSVFYCADSAVAAVKESNIKENEQCYISVWELQAKRDLNYTSYLPVNLPENNYWEKIGYLHHNYMLNLNDRNLNYQLELRKFITSKFMFEEFPYPISSLIANENLYYGDHKSDLIIYPSAKTMSDYVNYAFHPNVVNEHLKLKKVFNCKITKFYEDYIQFGVAEVGRLENNRIIWSEPTDEDRIYFNADEA